MALTTEARTELIQLVVGMFGAAPGASVLTELTTARDEKGLSVKQIAANIANTAEFKSIYPTFLTNQEFAERFVNNLVGSEVAAADKAAAVTILVAQLNAGATRSNVVVDAINALKAVPSTNTAWANGAAALANKVTVATYYTVDKQLSGSSLAALQNVIATVTSTAASVTAANTSVDGTANIGQVFTLTTGADTFNGGAGVDTFNAVETTGATWTVGDALNGGSGSDTLNITQTANVTAPLSATVSNIENVKVVTGGTATLDASSWAGLTSLNTTSAVDATLTAAATADVSATVSGVTAASNITVNGGKNVTVALSGSVVDGDGGAELTIGGTTAPAGAITVTNTNSAAVDQADVAITGGTTVTVTESLTNAVNTIGTQGDVTVTGGTATTAVTVNQDKAATAAATVVGKVNGAVTINDRNAASGTTAGVISTVSLNSYGTSTIDSSAISTVNLAGTGGALTISRGALTAVPTANTLALNLNGLSGAGATITDGEAAADDGFTTVNITSSTAASTVADLVVADATTINVAGDAKVTFTANTGFGAVTAITVTNTAGSSFGTALAAGVLFTGGAGADTVSLATGVTKAITMGAGDDIVTYGGPVGVGGSVAAGDGSDTIVMSGAEADAADASSTFNTKYTGFEVLDVETGATETVNLAGINGVNKVVTRGAAGLTLDGFATGGTLTLDAAGTNLTANVTNAVLTAGDTFNVSLSTAAAAAIAFGSVTLAGIETVNIATVDGGTLASAATVGTATLVATAATSVVVSGNNGLNLTNAGNTAITTFNASGVVGNSTSTAVDTAANLGVTFTSANVTTTATVTITGGVGNDTLSGAAAKDTINGGAGADVVAGGLGVDTITVGEGRDIVVVNSTAGTSTDSGTAAFDSVTGFKVSEVISIAVDLSSNALFQAATAGGANASLLNLDVDAAAADQAITIEPTATSLAGQAVGVTYSVSSRGILTLGGTGASAVDTLAEWLTEASAVAATLGDILAFEFGGDTYVFAENAAQDVLVKLVGVTGATGLVEVSAATTSTTAGAILYADIA